MSLRQKSRLAIVVAVIGIAVICLGQSQALRGAGILITMAACFLSAIWFRCPHCGKQLRGSHDDCCRGCGMRIDWDAK